MPQIVNKSEVSEKTWNLLKQVYDQADDAYLVLQVKNKRLEIAPLTEWLEDSDRR